MIEITVDIERRPHQYRILVGEHLPDAWMDEVEKNVPAETYFAVVDAAVARGNPIEQMIVRRPGWRTVRLAGGEERKNLEAFSVLFEQMLEAGLDRGSVAVAIGGGVVGDMVGFAAATFMRGIRHVQIPTTLLAQVDSSVGGKTGINIGGGKNLIGAFHQPGLVLVDTSFLASLPEREYLAGLAEVVKYGVIGDREFFHQLTANAGRLAARETALLSRVVAHCCRLKAGFVAADEREGGRRALLNFGHTFGHALEALAGYDGSVVHGEAVSVGMVAAGRFAVARGLLAEAEFELMAGGMAALGLPVRLSELGWGRDDPGYWTEMTRGDELPAVLTRDKKASGGNLTLVLPYEVGDCRLLGKMDAEEAAELLRRMAGE